MKLELAREFGGGVIWHLVPAKEGRIALEIRSEDQLEVRFVVVDLQTKDQASFESDVLDWWTALQGFGKRGLIFKRFADDKDPSKHEYFELLSTGDSKSATPEDIVEAGLAYPQFYQAGSTSFQLVADYLWEHKVKAVAGAEYTEWRDLIVVGYYQAVGDLLDRHLLALDREGVAVLHEKIDTGMQGVVFESFFTFTEYLVFVKERKELNVYRA
ncbi:MAG: hypothetical protein AAGA85_09140 [Bacteroidota bacterium]